MAYTPINWQTGDTITAEKMNKMDNGWDVQNAQLFSETLTTTAGQMGNSAIMAYAGDPSPISTMTISFDGIDYTCEAQSSDGQYWWGAPNPSDFSTYPFVVLVMNGSWYLITETAGTHTVTGAAKNIETSEDFRSAVNSVVDTSTMPMLCVSGTTTYAEMASANASGKLLFFRPYTSQMYTYIITGFSGEFVNFIPTDAGVQAYFSDGVFAVALQ